MKPPRFSDLSPARQEFVRQCQRIGFGRVEKLYVDNGNPVFGPETRILRDIKLDIDTKPRAEGELPDFVLTAEFIRLFGQLEEVKNGIIEQVDVREGIPRRLIFYPTR